MNEHGHAGLFGPPLPLLGILYQEAAPAEPPPYDRVTIGGVSYPPDSAATPIPEPPDHEAAREARRREVTALLLADAAETPTYAKARLRAVMAALEERPLLRATLPDAEELHAAIGRFAAKNDGRLGILPQDLKIEVVAPADRDEPQIARDILAELHLFEGQRRNTHAPRRDPGRWLPAHVAEAVEVYERSRGLS